MPTGIYKRELRGPYNLGSSIERFKRFLIINKDTNCWEWIGGTSGGGYGKFRVYHKQWLAHRWSYEYFTGTIPEGLLVLHACDNPSCVNPDHLFVGTQADNQADMVAKGRQFKGPRS